MVFMIKTVEDGNKYLKGIIMKTYINKLYLLCLTLFLFVMSACDNKDDSNLSLQWDTFINKIVLDDEYEGVIDNVNASIAVEVPFDYSTKSMTVSQLELSEGADATVKVGDKLNFSLPQSIRITNGDAFFDYLINVKNHEAKILSLTLNNIYNGIIDDETKTIKVYVPLDTDMKNIIVDYEVNDGSSVSIDKNSVVDFTNNNVKITVTYKTAFKEYSIVVEKTDVSVEPKAFVGIANTVSELNDETKAAAEWMLKNIPNSKYISLNEIKDGKVRLTDYKMIWCHWDWNGIGDWPSAAYDTKDKIREYWNAGGNIFASREAMRYVKTDMWGVSSMNAEPNNMWGGEYAETTLTEDLGFSIKTYEDQEIYNGITVNDNSGDKIIYLREIGCKTTGRALQWGVDWDPYFSMDEWKQKTGATPLASGIGSYDVNRVCIAQYGSEPNGTVITIGASGYEWKDANVDNAYFTNMEKLTMNIINYLCK